MAELGMVVVAALFVITDSLLISTSDHIVVQSKAFDYLRKTSKSSMIPATHCNVRLIHVPGSAKCPYITPFLPCVMMF